MLDCIQLYEPRDSTQLKHCATSDAPRPSRNYFSHSFALLFGVGIISLRFDAPALRTLFAITVAVLLMTTIFTVAEQRPDS